MAGSPLADVAATTHASLVCALMPTSHNIIIFTLATTGIASVSILFLIVACLIPAVILTPCNLAAAYFVAVKRGYPTRGDFTGWHEVARASRPPCPACW